MPTDPDALSSLRRITDATVEKYTIDFPQNLPNARTGGYRSSPPVIHRLTIAGKHYTFIAVDDKPWVTEGDTVTFDYRDKGRYRNIRVSTIAVKDANGQPVVRGYRQPETKTDSTDSE